MSYSSDLLGFMDWISENGLDFDLIEECSEDMEADEEYVETERQYQETLIELGGMLTDSRSRPTVNFKPDLYPFIERLVGVPPEAFLNRYFTRRLVQQVHGMVERFAKLEAVHVEQTPAPKISDYLQQASNCYLFGLYESVAILSRAVIQFALEEALSARNGAAMPSTEGNYIEKLINWSEKTKILSVEMAEKAHEVRRYGNEAVHTNMIQEEKALECSSLTRQILSFLYRK